MTLVPTVDPLACADHGDCVDVAPNVFALDGDLAAVIGTDQDSLVLAAAEACPSAAIVVHDGAGAVVFP